ncbi:MAG: aldehyde dehydrogenase [Planctomycetota bacterium]
MTENTTLNFINGQYTDPIKGQWIENVSPVSGEVIGKIAQSTMEDIDAACQSAKKVVDRWANMPIEKRAEILHRIADLIDENSQQLVKLESEDCGKPITRARTIEIPRAASNFRFFAAAITQFASETHESVGWNAINLTLRSPLGIVACISPWNLPLYLFTWKIAPALATGNCVIAKPSELTPRTASFVGELCNQAGLPKGVLNIIQGTGDSAGQAILEHPEIKAVSFTGGTATGKKVAATVAPQFKKLSLELGGKNPNIIFADCDYDKALAITVYSSFGNQGQICLCGSRILIEESIYERFRKDLIAKTRSLKIGNPSDDETEIGTLISKSHFEKVLAYLKLADEEGATLLCGGKPAVVEGSEQGCFIEPTIYEIENHQSRICQEEIFGPVVTLHSFRTEEEALQLANGTPYGLSATLWTTDLDRTMRMTRQIESGVIWVNSWLMRDLRTPFGGMKASGVGREGGFDSLRFFTQSKNVCISYRAK